MKKLLILPLTLLLALFVGGALLSTIDTEQFKPLLVEQVRHQTGRELRLDGPIGWRFWPSLGLTVDRAALRNPAGFSEPDFIRLERASASVALLPLLSHRLEIGEIRLQGAHLLLETRKDGRNNLEQMGPAPEAATGKEAPHNGEATTAPGATPSDAPAWQIRLGGIALEQASALILDGRTGRRLTLDNLDLTLGGADGEGWMPLTLSLLAKEQAAEYRLSGQGELRLGQPMATTALRRLSVEGSLQRGPLKIEAFSLKAEHLALATPSPLTLTLKGGDGVRQADLKLTTTLSADGEGKTVRLGGSHLTATLEGAGVPRTPLALDLNGDIAYDSAARSLSLTTLKARSGDLTLGGEAFVTLQETPLVRFNLQGGAFGLDEWLATTAPAARESTTDKAPATAPQGATQPRETQAQDEPDLSALKGVNLDGQLRLAGLTYAGLTLTQPEIALTLDKGLLTLKRFKSGFDQGQLNANGQLDARQHPASYRLNAQGKDVQIRPLLQQLAQSDLLSGRTSLSLAVQGHGLSQAALRRGIAGQAHLKVEDGALHGVNLPEMIREAKATLKGQRAEYVKEERKTDFSALTASFQLGGGKARSNDIQLFAPALRVHGSGETDLVSEGLDFLFNTSVVGTSKGQGGRDVGELAEVTIPVRITGSWSQPSYALDLKALLQNNKLLEEKARKEAERGINKLLGDKGDPALKEAADKLLKGLFN
ncbi:AsmA family protein [Aeromonas schubertii]|uniref:AsmA family protein n=1 Tax=Aeromonas schubertii TaxID=652 RepID=UPI0038B4DE50